MIPKLIRVLRIAFALVITATVADAGPGTWTSGGPYGGDVMALAVNPATPSTVYAGTDGGGVFKSTDAGGTWAAVNTGLTSPNVRALAINPTTPSTVYVGTVFGAGVFKSTDAGATWAVANTGLTSHYVDSLAINPATPTTVYAGTDGGIFRSTDGGSTWNAVNTGLTQLFVDAIAIDPVTPTTLYAGTYSGGIFRSTNSGTNWTAVNTGLTNLYVYTLAINPAAPGTIYAGTDTGPFKSTNSGATWASANTGIGAAFVGVLAIDPTTPATLYAATDSAVFKSINSGGSWTAANTGLTTQPVMSLAINPTTTATLYAGAANGGGVFKSANAAGTWSVTNQGLNSLYARALAINPTTPSTVYAGMYLAGGIFKSINSGGSWTAINTGLPSTLVTALAINPTTPTTIYAGTNGSGVFKSTDAGGTWGAANTALGSLTVWSLAINPATPSTLYAGTDAGIFKSIDAGGTWTDVSVGLTSTVIHALVINPAAPATVYAATDDGVFKTTTSGAPWAAAKTGLTNLLVSALAIDPTTPATLYAGTAGGVFKSTNSAGSWTAANTGLSTPAVLSLAIHPTSTATVYAGTQGGGVFTSTDSAGSWTTTNPGLTNPILNVWALASGPAGSSTLYAGIESGSVWQLSAVTGTAPSITTQPVSQAVTPGATASFSAAASGSPSPTVQWQLSTNSGTSWTDIGGATSTTYSFTAALADSGKQYRAVFTNSAGSATTNSATLTVSTTPVAPAVTTQPANQTVTAGATASFSAAASGAPSPTVQWQASSNSGATWSDIGGATSTTYSFTAALTDSGKQYRAVFTNSAGSATSNAATLTVTTAPSAPVVTTQPANRVVLAGTTASFSAAASGSPTPAVRWQVSTDGGASFSDVAGATATTYAFIAAAADNGKRFRAVFTNSSGTATSDAAILTVTTTPPSVAIDKTSLVFAAVTTGTAFTSQTSAQIVRLTQGGPGTVTWTATSNAPWLVVSPASGTGPATLTVSTQFASGLSDTQNGSISLVLTGASNAVGPISVRLTTVASTAPASPPFGVFDTPAGDGTVLAGSIAVTGWTLDNIGVKRVELWRDLLGSENTPPFVSSPSDPRNGKVFIANATFVDGARPDVEALNPGTPLASRAGWGYLLLTWGLANQGNGTYTLYAYAFDEENNLGTIGTKTIVVSNNTATKPFGSIDTPAIGGDASGPNYGWGLTPKVNGLATCRIPSNGVQVSIDSGPLQPVFYGDARTDIAGLFSGFSNSAAAGGHFLFDWSTLSPGVHTISWLLTDDCGRSDGVGSRFFNVTGGVGAVTASADPEFRLTTFADASAVKQAETTEAGSQDVLVSRGYGELSEIVTPDERGDRTIEAKQGDRIEIRLPRGFSSAYQLGPDGRRRALPDGSAWDGANGILYWQPAPGFLGTFRFVFSDGGQLIRVRVVATR